MTTVIRSVISSLCLIVLLRCSNSFPPPLLKVRLLTYCYGEVYEEALLREAHEIIGSWDNTSLSSGQAEIIEELRNIEENPYPYEVIE